MILMSRYLIFFGSVTQKIMDLLLDTHAFIWWYNKPSQLPEKVLTACQDASNVLMLSVASVWEMQIKTQLEN